jgi:hypothetical protein
MDTDFVSMNAIGRILVKYVLVEVLVGLKWLIVSVTSIMYGPPLNPV